MKAALCLVALAAVLAAGSEVRGSNAAFTAAGANPSNDFSTAADWVSPTVTISAPADGSFIAEPVPTLVGTAGDGATDGATVTVRVFAGTQATGTPVQTLHAGRSGAGWTIATGPLADGTYTVRATQTDGEGNTGTSAARGFTVDTVRPTATAISTANAGGGTAGRLDTGDSITFTYGEPILPISVLSTFSGSSANVQVQFTDGPLAGDRFTVRDGSGGATVNLESGVDTGADLVTLSVTFTSSTLTRSGDGRSLTIVLGTPSPAGIRLGTAPGANMTWTPKAGPTDRAGNGLADITPVTQTGTPQAF